MQDCRNSSALAIVIAVLRYVIKIVIRSFFFLFVRSPFLFWLDDIFILHLGLRYHSSTHCLQQRKLHSLKNYDLVANQDAATLVDSQVRGPVTGKCLSWDGIMMYPTLVWPVTGKCPSWDGIMMYPTLVWPVRGKCPSWDGIMMYPALVWPVTGKCPSWDGIMMHPALVWPVTGKCPSWDGIMMYPALVWPVTGKCPSWDGIMMYPSLVWPVTGKCPSWDGIMVYPSLVWPVTGKCPSWDGIMMYTALVRPVIGKCPSWDGIMMYPTLVWPVTGKCPSWDGIMMYTALVWPVTGKCPSWDGIMMYPALVWPVIGKCPSWDGIMMYPTLVWPVTGKCPSWDGIMMYPALVWPVIGKCPSWDGIMMYPAGYQLVQPHHWVTGKWLSTNCPSLLHNQNVGLFSHPHPTTSLAPVNTRATVVPLISCHLPADLFLQLCCLFMSPLKWGNLPTRLLIQAWPSLMANISRTLGESPHLLCWYKPDPPSWQISAVHWGNLPTSSVDTSLTLPHGKYQPHTGGISPPRLLIQAWLSLMANISHTLGESPHLVCWYKPDSPSWQISAPHWGNLPTSSVDTSLTLPHGKYQPHTGGISPPRLLIQARPSLMANISHTLGESPHLVCWYKPDPPSWQISAAPWENLPTSSVDTSLALPHGKYQPHTGGISPPRLLIQAWPSLMAK